MSTSIGSQSKELVNPALRQIYVPMPTYTRMEGFIEEEEISEDRDQSTPTPGKEYTRVSAENPNIVVTSMTPQENDISIGTVLTSDGGTLSTLLKDLDPTNSGSGSGLPLLIQRTIALQINIIKDVGSGRFGEVKLGQWRGENVAVKIFCSRDESSWAREVEIYNTNWLRHANILQYIASDKKDTGLQMELWLITEYHPFGSLYDFLAENVIDTRLAVQLLRSFANGMQFLHSEIPGQFNKPAIAHRDIKSKNVLVKADKTCVIADLGLAVRYENGILNIPENTRCGTTRYLAPEILIEENIFRSFEPFKMADMYSFGLVMWEILSRTKTENFDASPFEESMPYWEHVPRDPSFMEMKKVVVDEEKRPALDKRWRLSQVHQDVWKVMDECWRPVPGRRLTAMNVRLKLDRLAQKYNFDSV
ncbi:unnamed protein product, partial [Mesorhabditis belari]|uniref:receptor protein serine/threonine kinase n=1 Tax=Mesorhabditis belari TaxID=2138241 RepID=A0AAF3FHL2_9BILA